MAWHGQLMSAIAGHCLLYVLLNEEAKQRPARQAYVAVGGEGGGEVPPQV